MTHLSTFDQISIAQIVIYAFFFVASIYLCIKHGFLRGGFRFILVLSLARLLGGAFYLATIAHPTNFNLYIGWATTNGIGLSPLVLILVGFAGRMLESIHRNGHTKNHISFTLVVELITVTALVLVVIGGTKSHYIITDGHETVHYSVLSKVGMGVMLGVTILFLYMVAMAVIHRSRISQGEHLILPVTLACIPFILVRLVYSCVVIFKDNTTKPWPFLGAEIIMEMIVVLMCEALGFMMERAPPRKVTNRNEEDGLNGNMNGNKNGEKRGKFRMFRRG